MHEENLKGLKRRIEKGKYVASFTGFFPAYNPQFVILVAIDSPSKTIWGSTVAAPVFKNIAKDIIRHYQIPPDKYVLKKGAIRRSQDRLAM